MDQYTKILSPSLITIYITLITISFLSCDDYLEQTPEGELTLEEIFSERNYAESFLYNVYSYCPDEQMMAWHGWMGWEWNLAPFNGASDEMEHSWTTPYSQLMNTGAWNASDRGTFSSVSNTWKWYFEGIRKANLFLENINKTPMDETEKQHWIGEAYFLRAFYHFMLFRVFGPIPILDRPINVDEDFNSLLREPIELVVNFIQDDCDKAASMLNVTVGSTKYGRATSIAALALKSRLLLYAASDLFNGNSDYNDFMDIEGTRLFPKNKDPNKWAEAAQAALKCITEAESAGYKLYYSTDNDPLNSYQQIFIKSNNSESLFQKNVGYNSRFEEMAAPNGMGGWSGLNPTQNLVDAYEMITGEQPILGYNNDGSPIINSKCGYSENGYTTLAHPKGYYLTGTRNMYVNRDPRLYASILFNGAYWRGRQVEFYITGKDGRKSGPDFPSTGYIIKKFAEPTVDIPRGIWAAKFWIYFRLSEQYLNYAEAINETEGPEKAYRYINLIRKRAGMPNLPSGLSKEEMRKRIRNERRIELAFEGHRYFDCHRWKIAENTEGSPIYGLDISQGNNLQDDSFYARKIIETRVFESPKHYLWPIPQHEINKNQNLKQNYGW